MEFDYDPKRAQEELIYLKEIEVRLSKFLRGMKVLFNGNFGVKILLSPPNLFDLACELEDLLKKKILRKKRNGFLDNIQGRENMLIYIKRLGSFLKPMLKIARTGGKSIHNGFSFEKQPSSEIADIVYWYVKKFEGRVWIDWYRCLIHYRDNLKAIIKEKGWNADTWKEVVKTSKSKIIDLTKSGFLYHGTSMNWTKDHVENFIKVGLLSPFAINKIGAGTGLSNTPHSISFTLKSPGVQPTEYVNQYRLGFIISPEYVKAHSGFVYCGGIPGRESPKYSKELNMYASHDYNCFPSEVRGPENVPFRAIIGIILVNEIDLGPIRYLMTKLISIDPKLVFPIYDIYGNVLWPSLE